MAVHSLFSARYKMIVEGRYLDSCLIAVGRSRNPFFFSCAHHAQAIVRNFPGKLLSRENPVTAGACGVRVINMNYCEPNCFK
jgi:hypothetical protein